MTEAVRQEWLDELTIQPSGCWTHAHALNRDGYQRVQVNGRRHLAHRLVYEWLVGAIPTGLTIDHLCRNRGCVNPTHLEPVTLQENLRRGESPLARKARQTHCVNGHPLDKTNTYRHGTSRKCRICRREALRRFNQRRRAA